MSVTNFGQIWPSSWTTDATITGSSLASSATITSSPILNTAASPNEVLDTECNLTFAMGSSAISGPMTISILRQTQGGYQNGTTDTPYSFAYTPTISTTANVVFVVPGSDAGGFKVYVSNGTGQAITASSMTLSYRQSQGGFG